MDEYFVYRYGRLPYRILRFEHTRSRERLPHVVINQSNALPRTRIYDHRWFSGEEPERAGAGIETVLTKEYPLAHDGKNEPYYPMSFGEGMALYQRYKVPTEAEARTIFLGRLATYMMILLLV